MKSQCIGEHLWEDNICSECHKVIGTYCAFCGIDYVHPEYMHYDGYYEDYFCQCEETILVEREGYYPATSQPEGRGDHEIN